MKRLYVTRGVRVENEGDSPEDIGEFLAIDWENKEIIGTYLADSHEKLEQVNKRVLLITSPRLRKGTPPRLFQVGLEGLLITKEAIQPL